MQKKEMERDGMKKGLLGQITKFGLVGVLCFFVDYFTYRLGNCFFETTGIAASFPAYVYVSQALGFTDSVIVNYLLSMKYVFARKDNLSRKEEFS
ncbi:MAG: GtrA family protein, partial [Lachnospiraceae bacterium]|nr:GtrA family protein [Lachnospiraceae bacterium]